MVGKAQAEPYYEMDKDNKKVDKKISVQSLKCNNINVNVNGLTLDVFPPFLGGGEVADGETDANSFAGNNGDGSQINDFRFVCINNNNNTVIEAEEPIPPVPPVDETATLNVTKTVACVEDTTSNGLSAQQVEPRDPCDAIEEDIPENLFLIDVTDTTPTPPQFAGSTAGTLVTLGAGTYTVEETPSATIRDLLDAIEDETSTEITGPFASFTGNCVIDPLVEFGATGNIAGGASETCNIVNTFQVTPGEPVQTTVSVAKNVNCIGFPFIGGPQPDGPECTQLLSLILPSDFEITVSDVITPPFTEFGQFPGSTTPVVVPVVPPTYAVNDLADASVFNDIQTVQNNPAFGNIIVFGPFPVYVGDCTQPSQFSTFAEGTIAAGDQQTCNVRNVFVIVEI